MAVKIKTELEMRKWFEKNFRNLGYSAIIKKDAGIFPDFIMKRNGKYIKVELETLSSNFILHNHDINKVDEVICIKNDVNLNLPIIELKQLEFVPRFRRISATVEKETLNKIDILLKKGEYRNKSHVIEMAIKNLASSVKIGEFAEEEGK